MGNIFGSAPTPPLAAVPAALPPPPSRSDAATQSLADAQRKRFAGTGGGRASTYLTGAGTAASSSAVRFLGGAAPT